MSSFSVLFPGLISLRVRSSDCISVYISHERLTHKLEVFVLCPHSYEQSSNDRLDLKLELVSVRFLKLELMSVRLLVFKLELVSVRVSCPHRQIFLIQSQR